jgi:hypothetical protein
VAYRKSGLLPENQVVDLYFRDFMADQIGTVRRAYEHFGMALPDSAANAMQAFLDENPADKHGKHLYSLANTGMEEAELRALFADYEAYFDVPREPL